MALEDLMGCAYSEMFAGCFGDERRAKRGLFLRHALLRRSARLSASLAGIERARLGLEGFCRTDR